MLKMIIVEDEKLEREGLVDFFDWESMGIEIAGVAVDGIDGLELAKEVRPDIIITDIKMPGKDGLQMSKEIRAILPKVKIIILTGYDDFSYAREAIGFRANAYVLKPVDEDEMLGTINEVIEQCLSQLSVEVKISKEYYAAQRRFLLDFLSGNIKKEYLLGLLHEYEINYSREAQHVLLIIKTVNKSEDNELKSYLYKLKNSISLPIIFELYEEEEGNLVYCLQMSENRTDILEMMLSETLSQITMELGDTIWTISNNEGEFTSLDEDYKSTKEVLEYALFWGIKGYINRERISEYKPQFNQGVGDFVIKGNEYTKHILKATGESDREKINQIIEEIFNFVNKYNNIDKKHIINYLYNIIYETSLLAYNLNKSKDEGFLSKDNLGNHVYELRQLSQIKTYFDTFFDKVIEVIDEKRNKKDEYIIKRVLKLIEENYSRDLSLKTISTEVFLSPNYLGNMFKKYTGKSFNDYLSDYRMNIAKQLLTTTNKKVSVIASEVGIANTSYFCIVFKNINGLAPQEFREMVKLG